MLFDLKSLLTLSMAGAYLVKADADEAPMRSRELGCVVYVNTVFNNMLPTTLTVVSSSLSNGEWCMENCGSSGGTDCGTNAWFLTSSLNCGLNTIKINNNGQGSPCEGAKGTITIVPESEYTSQSGLKQIIYSFDNSGGPNADTTTYSLE